MWSARARAGVHREGSLRGAWAMTLWAWGESSQATGAGMQGADTHAQNGTLRISRQRRRLRVASGVGSRSVACVAGVVGQGGTRASIDTLDGPIRWSSRWLVARHTGFCGRRAPVLPSRLTPDCERHDTREYRGCRAPCGGVGEVFSFYNCTAVPGPGYRPCTIVHVRETSLRACACPSFRPFGPPR